MSEITNIAACILFILSQHCISSCPDVCECTPDHDGKGVVENCTNVNLHQLPEVGSEYAERVSVLILDRNPLKNFTFSDLNGYLSLQRLSLQYCSLENIKFEESKLPHLENIDLSHNLLTKVDTKNSVHGSVKTLNLNNNHFKEIPGNIFVVFPRLENLFFSYNLLENIGPGMLVCNSLGNDPICATLTTVTLQNNRIMSVQPGSFESLPLLQALDLSKNQIKQMTEGVFKGIEHLKFLDLSHNYLYFIQPNVFEPLKNLKHLSLSYNHLETLPMDIPMLEWLDISHNDISVLTEDLKPILYPVEFFNLAHNPFMCDCHISWLVELYAQRKHLSVHAGMPEQDYVPKCSRPPVHAGVVWDKLTEDVLTCDTNVCHNCQQESERSPKPVQAHQLVVLKPSMTLYSVKMSWKLSGRPPEFPSVFIQYYIFGHQETTMKHIEVNIYQKEIQIRGLQPHTNYRFCIIPRMSAQNEGNSVMPLSNTHCFEATTTGQEQLEFTSLMWVFVCYAIGMLATVVFLVIALTALAFMASFFASSDKSTDDVPQIDEPITDEEYENDGKDTVLEKEIIQSTISGKRHSKDRKTDGNTKKIKKGIKFCEEILGKSNKKGSIVEDYSEQLQHISDKLHETLREGQTKKDDSIVLLKDHQAKSDETEESSLPNGKHMGETKRRFSSNTELVFIAADTTPRQEKEGLTLSNQPSQFTQDLKNNETQSALTRDPILIAEGREIQEESAAENFKAIDDQSMLSAKDEKVYIVENREISEGREKEGTEKLAEQDAKAVLITTGAKETKEDDDVVHVETMESEAHTDDKKGVVGAGERDMFDDGNKVRQSSVVNTTTHVKQCVAVTQELATVNGIAEEIQPNSSIGDKVSSDYNETGAVDTDVKEGNDVCDDEKITALQENPSVRCGDSTANEPVKGSSGDDPEQHLPTSLIDEDPLGGITLGEGGNSMCSESEI